MSELKCTLIQHERMTGAPVRRDSGPREIPKDEGPVKMGAETRVNTSISQGMPGATRSWENGGWVFPPRVWKERGPAETLI